MSIDKLTYLIFHEGIIYDRLILKAYRRVNKIVNYLMPDTPTNIRIKENILLNYKEYYNSSDDIDITKLCQDVWRELVIVTIVIQLYKAWDISQYNKHFQYLENTNNRNRLGEYIWLKMSKTRICNNIANIANNFIKIR